MARGLASWAFHISLLVLLLVALARSLADAQVTSVEYCVKTDSGAYYGLSDPIGDNYELGDALAKNCAVCSAISGKSVKTGSANCGCCNVEIVDDRGVLIKTYRYSATATCTPPANAPNLFNCVGKCRNRGDTSDDIYSWPYCQLTNSASYVAANDPAMSICVADGSYAGTDPQCVWGSASRTQMCAVEVLDSYGYSMGTYAAGCMSGYDATVQCSVGNNCSQIWGCRNTQTQARETCTNKCNCQTGQGAFLGQEVACYTNNNVYIGSTCTLSNSGLSRPQPGTVSGCRANTCPYKCGPFSGSMMTSCTGVASVPAAYTTCSTTCGQGGWKQTFPSCVGSAVPDAVVGNNFCSATTSPTSLNVTCADFSSCTLQWTCGASFADCASTCPAKSSGCGPLSLPNTPRCTANNNGVYTVVDNAHCTNAGLTAPTNAICGSGTSCPFICATSTSSSYTLCDGSPWTGTWTTACSTATACGRGTRPRVYACRGYGNIQRASNHVECSTSTPPVLTQVCYGQNCPVRCYNTVAVTGEPTMGDLQICSTTAPGSHWGCPTTCGYAQFQTGYRCTGYNTTTNADAILPYTDDQCRTQSASLPLQANPLQCMDSSTCTPGGNLAWRCNNTATAPYLCASNQQYCACDRVCSEPLCGDGVYQLRTPLQCLVNGVAQANQTICEQNLSGNNDPRVSLAIGSACRTNQCAWSCAPDPAYFPNAQYPNSNFTFPAVDATEQAECGSRALVASRQNQNNCYSCSSRCGTGTKRRVCDCVSRTGATINNSYCADNGIAAPALSGGACTVYIDAADCDLDWKCRLNAGDTPADCSSVCSTTCGSGNRGLAPVCNVQTPSQPVTVIDNTFCQGIVVPAVGAGTCTRQSCLYGCRSASGATITTCPSTGPAMTIPWTPTAPWRACSSQCGTGTTGTTVVCRGPGDVVDASEAWCTNTAKPTPPTPTCTAYTNNDSSCRVRWRCGASGVQCTTSCDKTCGDDGVMSLDAPEACRVSTNGGSSFFSVDNGYCTSRAKSLDLPSNLNQQCNGLQCLIGCTSATEFNADGAANAQLFQCDTNSIVGGGWTECSNTCGSGFLLTRQLCVDSYAEGTRKIFTSGFCAQTPSPNPSSFTNATSNSALTNTTVACRDFSSATVGGSTCMTAWVCTDVNGNHIRCADQCSTTCGSGSLVFSSAPVCVKCSGSGGECNYSSIRASDHLADSACAGITKPTPSGSACVGGSCPFVCRTSSATWNSTQPPTVSDCAASSLSDQFYSQCSNTCGTGTQDVLPMCQVQDGSGGWFLVDLSSPHCTQTTRPASRSRACTLYIENVTTCNIANRCYSAAGGWDASCATECSLTCGTSVTRYQQSRSQFCSVSRSGTVSTLGDATVCNGKPTFAVGGSCFGGQCPWQCSSNGGTTYSSCTNSSASAAHWSDCSNSCGTGTLQTQRMCIVTQGATTTPYLEGSTNAQNHCTTSPPTVPTVSCEIYTPNSTPGASFCGVEFRCDTGGGNFVDCNEQCSVTCGTGSLVYAGTPRCRITIGTAQPATRADNFCGAVPTPAPGATCVGGACRWRCQADSGSTVYDCSTNSADPIWSGCSTQCGFGTLETDVVCYNGGVVTNNHCAKSTVPDHTVNCEDFSAPGCTVDWKCRVGGADVPCQRMCSVNCGSGVEVNNGTPTCYANNTVVDHRICRDWQPQESWPVLPGDADVPCIGGSCPYMCQSRDNPQNMVNCASVVDGDDGGDYWTPCSTTCGHSGQRTKNVVCADNVTTPGTWVVYPPSGGADPHCAKNTKPTGTAVCADYSGSQCDVYWKCSVGGNPSDCSVSCDKSCGDGTSVLNGPVSCYYSVNSGALQLVPAARNHTCAGVPDEPIPTHAQPCNGGFCPYFCHDGVPGSNPPFAQVGACDNEAFWGNCTNTCGDGHKRTVRGCYEGQTLRSDTYCRFTTDVSPNPGYPCTEYPSCARWQCDEEDCTAVCPEDCGDHKTVYSAEPNCFLMNGTTPQAMPDSVCERWTTLPTIDEDCNEHKCPWYCRKSALNTPGTCDSPSSNTDVWGQCSNSCGTGNLVTQYVCYNTDTSSPAASSSYCANSPQASFPQAAHACSEYSCDVSWACRATWNTTAPNYSTTEPCVARCNTTCGTSNEVFQGPIVCMVGGSISSDESVCQNNAAALPARAAVCYGGSCPFSCRSFTDSSVSTTCSSSMPDQYWGPCSNSCGDGRRSPQIFCHTPAGDANPEVAAQCAKVSAPTPGTIACTNYVDNGGSCRVGWMCRSNGVFASCAQVCTETCGDGHYLLNGEVRCTFSNSTTSPVDLTGLSTGDLDYNTFCASRPAVPPSGTDQPCKGLSCPYRCRTGDSETLYPCDASNMNIWYDCSTHCGQGNKLTEIGCHNTLAGVWTDMDDLGSNTNYCSNNVLPTPTGPVCEEYKSGCAKWQCEYTPPATDANPSPVMEVRDCALQCSMECSQGNEVLNGTPHCYINGVKQPDDYVCQTFPVTQIDPLPVTGAECWGTKCPYKCRPPGSGQLYECDDTANMFGTTCSSTCGDGQYASEVVCVDIYNNNEINSTLCAYPSPVIPVSKCAAYSGASCERSLMCRDGSNNLVACDSSCNAICGDGSYVFNGTPECVLNGAPAALNALGVSPCDSRYVPAPTLDQVQTGACTGRNCGFLCQNPNSFTIGACASEDYYAGCDVTCGTGKKLTEIVCANSTTSTELDPSLCADSAVPTTSTFPCVDNSACGTFVWKCNASGHVTDCTSQCSVTCGTGTQTLNGPIGCYSQTQAGYVLAEDSSCVQANRPVDGASCTGAKCPWLCRPYGTTTTPTTCTNTPDNSPGSWSDCSTFCGTGVRTTEVVCWNTQTSSVNAAGDLCAATGPKVQLAQTVNPVTHAYEMACTHYNETGCTVAWQCQGADSVYRTCSAACGETCGPSTMNLNGTPRCLVKGSPVDDSICNTYRNTGDALPTNGNACNLKQCNYLCRNPAAGSSFDACATTGPTWSSCSNKCGSGKNTTQLFCNWKTSTRDEKLTSLDYCSNTLPVPIKEQDCTVYEFNASTCNIRWQCRGTGGVWGNCESRCTKTCGDSTTTLFRVGDSAPSAQQACYVNNVAVADTTICTRFAQTPIPTTGAACNLQQCGWRCAVSGASDGSTLACTNSPSSTIWSKCSETCGSGTRTTSLVCVNESGTAVPASDCASTTRPSTSISCTESSLCPVWRCHADGQPERTCSTVCDTCGVGKTVYTNNDVARCFYNGTLQANTYCTSRSIAQPTVGADCSPQNCPYGCFDANSQLQDCTSTTASIWSACAGGATCGTGTQTANRVCTNGAGAQASAAWCTNTAVVPPASRSCATETNCGDWTCGTSNAVVTPCTSVCPTACGTSTTVYESGVPRCIYNNAQQVGANLSNRCPASVRPYPANSACTNTTGCAWGCRPSTTSTVFSTCSNTITAPGWSTCDNANQCGPGQTSTYPTCYDNVHNVASTDQSLCNSLPAHPVTTPTQSCTTTAKCGSWLCYDGHNPVPQQSCVRRCPDGCGPATDELVSQIGCFTYDSATAKYTLRVGAESDLYCAPGVVQTPMPQPQACSATSMCDWRCGKTADGSSATVAFCQPNDFWSTCDTPCGVSQVNRTVVCALRTATVASSAVADSYCASIAGGKPTATNSCEVTAGCTFSWKCATSTNPTAFGTCASDGSDFSSCSTGCGSGTRSRIVKCFDHLGAERADTLCATSKPSASQSCTSSSACTYSWNCYTGALSSRQNCDSEATWSSCSVSCGQGTQTRTAVCVDSNGAVQTDRARCTASEPATARICEASTTCVRQSLAWSACSPTCLTTAQTDAGTTSTKTRTVRCTAPNGSVVSNALCGLTSNTETAACSVPVCNPSAPPPAWDVGGWSSACYGTCGVNAELRSVRCLSSGTPAVEVDATLCPAASKPTDARPCSTVTVQPNPCNATAVGSYSSGECILAPVIAGDGVTYSAQVGTCSCLNGFTGTVCSSRPRIINLRIPDIATNPVVVQNSTRTITWEYIGTTGLPASIVLYKDGSTVGTPIGQVAQVSSGTFSWVVPTDLLGGRYTIEVYASPICSATTASFTVSSVCSILNCGSNGTCDANTGTCTCRNNYTGERCTISPCDRANCNAAGTASCDNTSGTCVCLTDAHGVPTFTGPRCLTPVSCSNNDGSTGAPVCVNGGVNTAGPGDTCGACACQGSWAGETCATCGLTCSHGTIAGSCASCNCDAGYHGNTCACRHLTMSLNFLASRQPWWSTDEIQQRVWLRTLIHDLASLLDVSTLFPRNRVRVSKVETNVIYNVTYRTVSFDIAGDCPAPNSPAFTDQAGYVTVTAATDASYTGSSAGFPADQAALLHPDDVTMWDLYAMLAQFKSTFTSPTGVTGTVLQTIAYPAGLGAADTNCESTTMCPTGLAPTQPATEDPTDKPETPDPSEIGGKSVSGDMTTIGVLIGIVIGAVILAALLIFFLCFRKKKKRVYDEAELQARVLAAGGAVSAAAAASSVGGVGVYGVAGAQPYAAAGDTTLQDRLRGMNAPAATAGNEPVMHVRVRGKDASDDELPSDASD